ncbi:helix-turn-helix transcriptional regulator [Promicromonospora citrea]|uniref:Transcriptional regulator n=1 Tax=Promicromonospora citrea TaxID=43677 RepID=A0A8H9GPX5_9MICO|nr:LuxR family transcriptional regulator [Promicromonospora citrea]NNH53615.1 AAA family ATPase [Promicromonospora citrea]GGM44475.1 transcriptional regulator [Promicromonospora citrea]
MPPSRRLLGRAEELTRLQHLVARARAGSGGTVVLTGEAGIGKTALLDEVVAGAPPDVRVERMVASESEVELTFASLQLLCGHLLTPSVELPGPRREAVESAFGVRAAEPPNPLHLGLGVRDLLTRTAGDGALLCVVDDAQWLDEASASAVASVARRLSTERVAMVLAMRSPDDRFADLPQLAVTGLADGDARALLGRALPGAMDGRVLDQLLVECRGNPLALRELPRSVGSDLAGGYALAGSVSLERRIERSLLAGLEDLSAQTRTLLLLAAADPTGDPGLLWRASARLGLEPEDVEVAQQTDALVVSGRIRFRHPLIRSAVYRSASPPERRAVHAALAEATYAERDPDRRAWHRANATIEPTEQVAADLVESAERARARGGVAATAAFLTRAAHLTPDPATRVDRLVAAAESTLDAGAPDDALRLLDETRDDVLGPLHAALLARLRARCEYALRRDRSAPRRLLAAAQALEPHDAALARDTYMQALSAAVYAGRLGEPGAVQEIAEAIMSSTADGTAESAPDLILRGQAQLALGGPSLALPTVRRAITAFESVSPSDHRALAWMWFAGRAAQDIWDADGLRMLAERQVRLARDGGVLTVLPMALNLLMVARTFDGRLDGAEAICDDIDTILSVTGHPLPLYGRIFLAAYRGHVDEVESRAPQLRADAYARGEGYALTVANMAEAVVYNGAGRYEEALASAREEMPYVHELGHAMRTMLEVVEAAAHVGDQETCTEAVERLRTVVEPVGDSPWATALMALVRALHGAADPETQYLRAISGFEQIRVPILRARSQLLYGEMLRRQGRRVDARVQLRAAESVFAECGMQGYGDRARAELAATGEKLRPRGSAAVPELTDQERNVARLARDGLTNREIGARLFISSHTAEWHLRKVFTKLGVRSRTELWKVLPGEK